MKTILLISLISLGACATDGVDVDSNDDVTVVPRLSSNALTPAQLTNASLSAATLNSTNLTAMAQTVDGRASLGYVVGCALSSGTTLTATVGGIPYQFKGAMGMVPAWTTRALTTSEQHWISGCVLGRVNKIGVAITVSLRGAQTGLTLQGTESTDFRVQEGAFFGNVFAGRDFSLNACMGRDQALSETYGDLPDRDCTEPNGINDPTHTQCGFTYAGLCSSYCTSNADGTYSDCTDGTTVFSEAVTTYLYGSL